MCGIGGYIPKNGDITDREAQLITALFSGLDNRGGDAWGYFDGKEVKKAPLSFESFLAAMQMINFRIEELFSGKPLILGHTRFATKGLPQENNNNHPLEGESWVISHNGQIYNDAYIKRQFGDLKDFPEVDSYAILLLLESQESPERAFRELSQLTGTIAIWAYYKPDHRLFLYRNSNPLDIAITKRGIWFASEAVYIPIKQPAFSLPPHEVYEVVNGQLRSRGLIYTNDLWTSPTNRFFRPPDLDILIEALEYYGIHVWQEGTRWVIDFRYWEEDADIFDSVLRQWGLCRSKKSNKVRVPPHRIEAVIEGILDVLEKVMG